MDAPDPTASNRAEWAALAASLTPLQNAGVSQGSNAFVQPFLAWLMGVLRPQRYVYIGANDCQSYFTLCRAVQQLELAAQAYAVDEWPDDAHYGEVSTHHDAGYSGWSSLLRMPWREALPHFSDGSIDLLCIEAAQPGEAQVAYQLWQPRLSNSSVVVVIADTALPGGEAGERIQLNPIEGIQLIISGTLPPHALQAWLREWEVPAVREAMQRWFNGLGSRLLETHATQQRVAALSHEIGLRDQRIIGLENELAGDHEQRINELETAVEHERSQLAAWEDQFSSILSSKSWRLTRPLRAFMQRLRNRRAGGGQAASEGAPGTAPDAPPANRNDYAEWVRRYDTPGTPWRTPARAATAENRFTVFPSADTPRGEGAVGWQAVAHAIKSCDSEWMVLVNPHGRLADDALQQLDAAVQHHPQAVALYADSDYTGPDGRHTPQFRCAWNPALFLAQDYWGPLRAFRTDALREAVQHITTTFADSDNSTTVQSSHDMLGLRTELTLRVIEQTEGRHIVHIPRVLFHEYDTGLPDTPDEQRIARHRELVQAHLARSGVNASAEADAYGVRVRYALPDDPPLATLIIPTRNAVALMRQCIDSILTRTSYPNYEIIVVDNGSDDPEALTYFQDLAAQPNIRVLRDDNPFNYSALNNQAAAIARGDVLVLVNNDIEVISNDWLEEMIGHALQPGVGAVGARLWYPNDTLQHGGVILGIRGVAAHAYGALTRNDSGYMGRAQLTQNFTAVTAACLAVRKSTYDSVGGLNERDLTVAFNDIDFCLRLVAAGYRNVWTPHAQLYHHESVSRGTEDNPQKRARFAAEVHYMKVRWGKALAHDAAYNPNLTLEDNDFSLAWPPRIETGAQV